jgi:hypothetical protein
METMKALLNAIYGARLGQVAFERLVKRIATVRHRLTASSGRFCEKDAVLITYGDTLSDEAIPPLQALYSFTSSYLKDSFSAIHFLPFFPYSSDDGFSVMDFYAIDPRVGSWRDVARFSQSFDLMFDYVLNHVSSKSQWFENYLAGHPDYAHLAIEVSPDAELSQVTRPRALPLLTPFGGRAAFLCGKRRSLAASGCSGVSVERDWYALHPPSKDPLYGSLVALYFGPCGSPHGHHH